MRNLIQNASILYLCLCSLTSLAQQDPLFKTTYYYTPDGKVNCSYNKSYLFVYTDNSFAGFDFKTTGRFKGYTLNSYQPVLESLSGKKWAELELKNVADTSLYDSLVHVIHGTTGVVSVSPTILTTDEHERLKSSNLFYVKLKDPADYSKLEYYANNLHLDIVHQYLYLANTYLLSTTSQTDGSALDISNELHESGAFVYAEPDLMYDYKLSCTNDVGFASQWGLKNTSNPNIDINACSAWGLSTGAGIKVAVVDEGIDLNHGDLSPNLLSSSYDVHSPPGPQQVQLVYGPHGTYVAGIAGAVKGGNGAYIAGTAPDCELISVSADLGNSVGTAAFSGALAGGIGWAKAQGADVMNFSWGAVAPTSVLDGAIDDAINNGRNGRGTVIVVATGNGNGAPWNLTDAIIEYPARKNNVLSVGAVNSIGERSQQAGLNSCYKPLLGNGFVNVVGPGVNILTTAPGNSTASKNGTSMASPFVAGVAALMLSSKPNLTSAQVTQIIDQTA